MGLAGLTQTFSSNELNKALEKVRQWLFNGSSDLKVKSVNAATAGIVTQTSTANTANPPTSAQLVSAFGSPASLGAGFIGVLDDNSDNTNVYLCYTSDTSWFWLEGTKAL